MSGRTDNIVKSLTSFGLESEESEIYLLLLQKGVMTALVISRETNLSRTKVYRILDKLISKNMVTIRLDDHGKKFEANSYSELEMLLAQKEAELGRLKGELPYIFNQLALITNRSAVGSKVLYYSGADGLKQITWNSLKATEPLRIFEISSMSEFMDQSYAEKMREEFVSHQIKVRQITNKKHLSAYTNNSELVKLMEYRYLDPKEMEIVFEVLIYDNVVAIYNFTDEDKFGIEIYNEKLAKTQKQLFDFVWSKAKKMRKIGERGEAVATAQ